ncbi:MAG: hypothetical protein HKM04_01025 [Legionellales bacterium]|nr:hypothetical protein [Legionellales bacterium]
MGNGLILTRTEAPTSILAYIGSVNNVLAARFPPELTAQRFNASDYAFGFEIASTDYEDALGEAILLNNYCYATSTEYDSAHYYQLRTAQDFITSGMFIIPRDCQAGWIAHYITQDHPLSFADFYLQLYQKVLTPMAFVALVEFENLHSIAIARPPIDGRAIFDHSDYYYSIPATKQRAVPAVVIGVLTDYSNPSFAAVNKQLEAVLYNNPMDTRSFPLTHHAHLLTLKMLPSSLLEVSPAMADKVRHLFLEESQIRSLYAEIYPIHALKNLFPF